MKDISEGCHRKLSFRTLSITPLNGLCIQMHIKILYENMSINWILIM